MRAPPTCGPGTALSHDVAPGRFLCQHSTMPWSHLTHPIDEAVHDVPERYSLDWFEQLSRDFFWGTVRFWTRFFIVSIYFNIFRYALGIDR